MSIAIAPELLSVLSKIEKDTLADLQVTLIPALIAEISLLSPASVQAVEAMILTAIQPAAQAALASLIAKVPAV